MSSTFDQLQLRAYRILHDGRMHTRCARAWAQALLGVDEPAPVIPDQTHTEFSSRELSLGATFD